METHSGGDDHDGRQTGGMDSTLVAIQWRLLGGRWPNGTPASESSNTGGTEKGSGRSAMAIQCAFCCLTPEMGM